MLLCATVPVGIWEIFSTAAHAKTMTTSNAHWPGLAAVAAVLLLLLLCQVVRLVAEHGYRDIGGSKNPEASLTGALSRDVLFTRLGPAVYALQVCVGGRGEPKGVLTLKAFSSQGASLASQSSLSSLHLCSWQKLRRRCHIHVCEHILVTGVPFACPAAMICYHAFS